MELILCPVCNSSLECFPEKYSQCQKLISHYRHEHISWYVWSYIEASSGITTERYMEIKKRANEIAKTELLKFMRIKLPLNMELIEELRRQ